MGDNTDLTICEIFEGLSPETLKDFQALGRKEKYADGKMLFGTGEPCSGVYWVSSGRVDVSVSDDFGRRLQGRVARRGELLGLKAMLCDEAYAATAQSDGPSEVTFVTRSKVSAFLSAHPDATFSIVEQLSHRLGIAFDQLRLLSDLNLSLLTDA